jgi:hypothetical protein
MGNRALEREAFSLNGHTPEFLSSRTAARGPKSKDEYEYD